MDSGVGNAASAFDVIVGGGGPAGLATAIAAASRGLSVVVCEHRALPVDKACGEGLMPPAIAVLQELGVRSLIDSSKCCRLRGIRLIDSEGRMVRAILPGSGVLGIRRVVLSAALEARAHALGVTIRERCAVTGFEIQPDCVIASTNCGEIKGKILVAADGLGSRLRKLAGLEMAPRGLRRFGVRQHFAIAPWSRSVEVHVVEGMEAYVTPIARDRVGISILWDETGATRSLHSFASLLRHFPGLTERVAAAAPGSHPRAAGPMRQTASRRTSDRFALVGDAAGYVDALTGEGLSLALVSGLTLAQILPDAIRQGATRASLAAYDRISSRQFRRYALVTNAVLLAARHRGLRRLSFAALGTAPLLFGALLKWTFADAHPHPQASEFNSAFTRSSLLRHETMPSP